MEIEDKKMHFIRLRTKNSQEPFVDPMSDIKVVMKQLFKELPHAFELVFGETNKVDYLKAYFKVLLTRLEEDKAPLDEQLMAFDDAMFNLLSDKERSWVHYYVFEYMLSTFALYERRDGAVDSKERGAIRASSAMLAMREHLRPGTFEKIKKEMADMGAGFNSTPKEVLVDALCVEDAKKTIKDVKEHVAGLIMPGSTWEEAAKACDNYAVTSIESDDKAVAASLAYPDYSVPYFESEVDSGTDSGPAKA